VYPVSIEFPKLVERTVSITATQGEPKTFPIELKFRWTDEHTRAVREVNYKIGHVEKAQNNIGTAITTTLNIAIADLKPGNYQLVIGAVGDLGMPSDEETIAVQIKESLKKRSRGYTTSFTYPLKLRRFHYWAPQQK